MLNKVRYGSMIVIVSLLPRSELYPQSAWLLSTGSEAMAYTQDLIHFLHLSIWTLPWLLQELTRRIRKRPGASEFSKGSFSEETQEEAPVFVSNRKVNPLGVQQDWTRQAAGELEDSASSKRLSTVSERTRRCAPVQGFHSAT